MRHDQGLVSLLHIPIIHTIVAELKVLSKRSRQYAVVLHVMNHLDRVHR